MKIGSVPRSGTSPHPEREQASSAVMTRPDDAPEAVDAATVPLAPPLPVRRPLSRRARLWLALGVAALVIIFLFFVHSVLRPFIWAAVVAYILTPLVHEIQRRTHLGRGRTVTAVMLVGIGLLTWGISAAVPTLRSDLNALVNSLGNINDYLATYLPNAGTPTIAGMPIQVTALIHGAQTTILDLPHMVLRDGFGVATGAVERLLRFLTFLISTFYLLLDAPRLGAWITGRIPPAYRGETASLARQVNTVLSEYLRAEVILILLMATASLIALSILGVHFALLLAPVVGFLEIFPIIGPFFAIALVTLIALIGPANFGLSHVSYAVVVALVFFVLRQLEDYLVIPTVVGHAVKLHPVVILFALLCGASIGGILGMFLAVPTTGALKVLGSYVYDRLVE